MTRADDIRQRALAELRRYEVLMVDGHFDYGNGYHGPAYLNPHQLLRYPSTIWRLAQDLLDLVPDDMTGSAEVVAGPPTGGPLLAHTIAGLLDSRRSLTHPPCSFAPFEKKGKTPSLRPFYRQLVEAIAHPGVPVFPLVEYPAPANFPSAECPLCTAGNRSQSSREC